MTDHFSQLTEAEQERLVILMEECSEVVKAGAKILRHGYESYNPMIPEDEAETNREALARECGDLLHAMSRMQEAMDISASTIHKHALWKRDLIKKYLHHQGKE